MCVCVVELDDVWSGIRFVFAFKSKQNNVN